MAYWLIAEDIPGNLEAYIMYAEYLGHQVITCRDGQEVVDYVKRVDAGEVPDNELPELFWLNYQMPRMNGLQVAPHVRASKRLANVPIILVTAWRFDDEEKQKLLNDYDIDAIFPTPISSAMVIEEIPGII